MTIFLVSFSALFPLTVPAGVGLYWICSNGFGVAAALLLNALHNPKKLAGAAAHPPEKRLTAAEKKDARREKKRLAERGKRDAARFFARQDKRLVFYSVSGGQYKYFQTVIEYILGHSDIPVHYITGDPNDAVFDKTPNGLHPYYIGGKRIISAMLKMDADMVIMTMPDLQKYHVKRSVAKDDIEYVYMFHTVVSMHMTLRLGAVDAFDTLFCVGLHHVQEIRQTEAVYGLAKKRLVKCGYSAIDLLFEAYKNLPGKEDAAPQILLAPSWQADCILDTCLDDILTQIVGRGYRVIVRPHPEYIKRFPQKMAAIVARWRHRLDDNFFFELDFSGADSIYQSDILITDWSNTAYEFSYTTHKPAIFINTPTKVMNPEYQKIGIEPLDITLRGEVGTALEPTDIAGRLLDTVRDMLENGQRYHAAIAQTKERYLYYPGRSGEAGREYIIGQFSRQGAAE